MQFLESRSGKTRWNASEVNKDMETLALWNIILKREIK